MAFAPPLLATLLVQGALICLNELLHDAQARAATRRCWGQADQAILFIVKLDRLARNVAFIAHLLEAGVDLVAVDMPDANRFMLHIMAAVAEQEARACSERTKAALAAAKARGVRLGWSNPKRKAEQKLASAKGAEINKRNTQAFVESMIPMVRECLRHGHRTPTAVARYLNKQGVQARRGGLWHPSSAANLLKAVKAEKITKTHQDHVNYTTKENYT